jgi:hypothetical protein
MTKTVIIPSNPADQKKIKDAVKEAADSLLRIDSEKEQIKTIVDLICEEHELPKSFVSRMIKTYHRSEFDKKVQEDDDFRALYETIIR